jgi:hypothetical protein
MIKGTNMFKTHRCFILSTAFLIAVGILTGTSAGQDIVLVDFNTAQDVIPDGWELVVNRGNADLRLTPERAGQALQLRSHNASFALQRETHLDLQENPYLIWTWKVTQLPSGGDFRQRKTDDQAAQLLVSFSATRFISYIWDSTAPKDVFGKAPSPPFRKIMAWVVQSGPKALGEWKTERRNLVDDYTKLFGEAPKTLRGLRIQINSQHTRSQAVAAWRSIILSKGQHRASRSTDHRLTAQPIAPSLAWR